LELCYLRQW